MNEFQTSKENLTNSRIVATTPTTICEGEINVKVDRFAFTANNITYAVMGERLRYWDFFQPQGNNPEKWGIIPVWGFADVVDSKCDDLPVGERLFGYFPPANQLTLTPSDVSSAAFIDASEHRTSLPPGYNLYRRTSAEPDYNREQDNERMLLFVLHLTSFCLHDMLSSNDWFGAKQVIVISASSKTSTGLGYGLVNDPKSPTAIGLTSARNIELVSSIGAYDQAITYDDIESIDAGLPTVIVDMSANTDVLSRLHTHLGDNMRFTSNVGLTHWDEPQKADGINQERSEMFFAPGHIQQRVKDWGREDFDKKSMAYLSHSIAKSREWMTIRELNGLGELSNIYGDVCNGTIAPNEGIVVVV